jgi:hypothetical protein
MIEQAISKKYVIVAPLEIAALTNLVSVRTVQDAQFGVRATPMPILKLEYSCFSGKL